MLRTQLQTTLFASYLLLAHGIAVADERPYYPMRGYVTGVRTVNGEFQALIEATPPTGCGGSPSGNANNMVLPAPDPLHRQILLTALAACVPVDFSNTLVGAKWKLNDIQILRSQTTKDSAWGSKTK